MLRPHVIGVTGYARHGKDTIGNLLVREYGFTKVAFADALKKMAMAIDPIVSISATGNPVHLSTAVECWGEERAKERLPEIRRFLQALGSEGVRDHLGADTWVTTLKKTIDAIDTPVVVTDVRFPNEARAIRDWGGKLWRTLRVNLDGSDFENGISTTHPSEHHVPLIQCHLCILASSVEEREDLVRKHASSWG